MDIHEGTWALFVRFGLSAANVGENDNELKALWDYSHLGTWSSES
jgi:hypothetical protein